METIKLLNMTDLTQIVEIKPLECKLFKFPYLTTVSCIMFMLFVFYIPHRKLFIISLNRYFIREFILNFLLKYYILYYINYNFVF